MDKNKKNFAIIFGILCFAFLVVFGLRLFAYNFAPINLIYNFDIYTGNAKSYINGQFANKTDNTYHNVYIHVILTVKDGTKETFTFSYGTLTPRESKHIYHEFDTDYTYKNNIKVEFESDECKKFTLKKAGFNFNPLAFLYLIGFGGFLTMFIFAVKPTKEQALKRKEEKLKRKKDERIKAEIEKLKRKKDKQIKAEIEKQQYFNDIYKTQKIPGVKDLNNSDMFENMEELQDKRHGKKTIICPCCNTINDSKNLKCTSCDYPLHKK